MPPDPAVPTSGTTYSDLLSHYLRLAGNPSTHDRGPSHSNSIQHPHPRATPSPVKFQRQMDRNMDWLWLKKYVTCPPALWGDMKVLANGFGSSTANSTGAGPDRTTAGYGTRARTSTPDGIPFFPSSFRLHVTRIALYRPSGSNNRDIRQKRSQGGSSCRSARHHSVSNLESSDRYLHPGYKTVRRAAITAQKYIGIESHWPRWVRSETGRWKIREHHVKSTNAANQAKRHKFRDTLDQQEESHVSGTHNPINPITRGWQCHDGVLGLHFLIQLLEAPLQILAELAMVSEMLLRPMVGV